MAKETNPIQEIISSYKKAFISLWIFSFVMNLLMLAPSFYMLQVYDRVFMSKNVMTLLMLSLILIFLFFIFSCLDYIRNLKL
jgi:ATP-binding cassette subfamily C exporter for protease/lipase